MKQDGSGPEPSYGLYGLAVHSRGLVFSADLHNNRIAVLNLEKLDSNVSCDDASRVLPVSADLHEPKYLWLDESRDRLYIGERRSGRVVVVDRVSDLVF